MKKCKVIYKHGGLPDSKFIAAQLRMGVRAESGEHTNNLCWAKQIAKSHLCEDPKYYTHLNVMEKKYARRK